MLISVDGLRGDRVDPAGARATPAISDFAAGALWWPNSWSQSNESLFSHSAMLTGRPVAELGGVDYRRYTLPEQAETLQEILGLYGYETGAFLAGGHIGRGFGFDQGWDRFEQTREFGSFFETAPAALEWVDERAAEAPFFLFLHGYDCHRPYTHTGLLQHPWPDDYRGPAEKIAAHPAATERVYGTTWYPRLKLDRFAHSSGAQVLDPAIYETLPQVGPEERAVALSAEDIDHVRTHYDSGALAADLHLGRFLDGLAARGRLEDTVVLITSDHGEDLGDHGFFNHRAVLRDSTTRVPLVLWHPGLVAADQGGVRTDATQAIDLVPTLLGFAGATVPAGLRGRALLDCDPTDPRAPCSAPSDPGPWVVQEGVSASQSVRSPTHRLVFRGWSASFPYFPLAVKYGPLEAPWFALYDTQADPGEHTNLLEQGEGAAEAEALRAALFQWWTELDQSGPQAQAPDPALLEMLRERGYW